MSFPQNVSLVLLLVIIVLPEADIWRCSVKKVFLEISQNSRKNPCVIWPATLSKKRLSNRCFPVNFAKFLRTFFTEHLRSLLLSFTGIVYCL